MSADKGDLLPFPARDEKALRRMRQKMLVDGRHHRKPCPFCGLWYRHTLDCFLARLRREMENATCSR